MLLFFSISSHAQNTVIKHYSVNQGLPSSECYWVMQDSKGYMWIATDAGIVKYDGYKFIIYNSSKGLPDNTVFKIHEDNHGRIWFATYSGKMAYYSYQTDSIYEIGVNNQLDSLTYLYPVDFAFDKVDTLFVSINAKGFVKIYPPEYKQMEKHFSNEQMYFLKKVNNKDAIYGMISPFPFTKKKVSKRYVEPLICKIPLNYGLEKDLDFKKNDSSFLISALTSHAYATRNDDTSFLFSNSISISVVSNKFKKVLFQLKNKNHDINHIITFFKDSKDHIWLNSLNSGVKVYQDNSFKKLLYHFLPENTITSVCEDSDNGFWLTSLEDGLYYIPSLDFKFIDKLSGLATNKVMSIALLNDELYCLTSDYTIQKLDTFSKKIKVYEKLVFSTWFLAQSKECILVCQSYPFILKKDGVTKVYPWVIRENQKTIVRIKKAIDFNQEYFLGFDRGNVLKINKLTGECFFILLDLPNIFSIEIQKDMIWIGTKSGLYSFSNNTLHFYGKDTPLLKNRVEDMLFVGDTLFLATRGYGVLCMVKNKIIRQYTELDGLASNMTKCIIKDKIGDLWVGTNRGISRFKKDSDGNYNVNMLNMNSGLVSNEVNQIIEHHQKLYLATNNGLGILNIEDFYNHSIPIPIYIEEFYVNNIKSNSDIEHNFTYDKNFIRIYYKGINVKSEGDIKYKYRLDGLDTNWTYSKNTHVQFTTLPPGDYKFIVYAINQNGELSEYPAIVSFFIKKPFWKTWWFYIVLSIFIFILFYLIYKRRIHFIKKQEQEKTEMNKRISESELKALRAQMNPHFMFNAINSIQNFVLKNDSKSAQKYLTKFARLIRSVLENSKHELVWLNKEVEALELYVELEALRASFCFDYEIIIDDSLNAENLFIPPMIIQPYIENAILHGIIPLVERRGKLSIVFSKTGTVLKCIIGDNGIGRVKAKEIKKRKQLSHQSMGMAVTQDRIDILNGQNSNLITKVVVTDNYVNEIAMGTTVEITINIKESQDD